MGHYDDFYEAAEAPERKRFEAALKRKRKLEKAIKEKYPEVAAYLEEFVKKEDL